MNLNQEKYQPYLSFSRDEEYWLLRPGAPKAIRADREPKTMKYEDLMLLYEYENYQDQVK